MNLIVAIIRPQQLGNVQKSLRTCGIDQMTVSNVLGGGHEPGTGGFIYRSTTIDNKLHSRLKLEIAVDEKSLKDAVEAIQLGAKTGQVGDGMIWVLPLVQAIRIRTGQELTWKSSRQSSNGKPSRVPSRLAAASY